MAGKEFFEFVTVVHFANLEKVKILKDNDDMINCKVNFKFNQKKMPKRNALAKFYNY